jgi:hypothetical protein
MVLMAGQRCFHFGLRKRSEWRVSIPARTPLLWRFAFGIKPGVAAARQGAANRTGVFQMANFFRKPRRGAKQFHLFDDEHFDWLATGPPEPEPGQTFLNYSWTRCEE